MALTYMDLQLSGKTAVVTGSTAGIGLAIARALAREGAAIVVNGRTEARVRVAAEDVRRAAPGARVSGVATDLGTAAGVAALIARVPATDILVNNLGVYAAKPFSDITDAEWSGIFETNVLSGVRLARHYLPGMFARNWGRVIFISSESAVQIPAEMIHYGVTKIAQVGLARGLAETTAGTGVTVNSVLAGPTGSEGVAGFVEQLARQRGVAAQEVEREFFQTARPSSLLRRFASPDEGAALVAFVASPLFSATNGAALRADVGVGVAEPKVGDRVAYTTVLGAYAEYAVVPADRVVRLPDGVSAKQGAAAMLQGLTAHYLATSTYPLKPGDACLVHAAAGGVGLLLCQIAKLRGARVLGTVSTREKAALARGAGADEGILYTEQDFESEVKRLTNGGGLQVIYDSVGKTTFEKGLNCLVRRGMMVLFGQSSGPVGLFDPQVLNQKGSLFLTRPTVAHYIATRAELLARAGEVLGWIQRGMVKVRIDRELPLGQAAEAHRLLEARQTTGKVLLIP